MKLGAVIGPTPPNAEPGALVARARQLEDAGFDSLWAVQAAGRGMLEAGYGRIVNISAVTAMDARENAANYCSSKAGLNMLTKCMALELAPHVSVNAVALGFVDSPIVRELYSEEQLSAVVTETPLATMGTHDHVSNLVRYLASDGAEFMTGQTIILDGGRIMR